MMHFLKYRAPTVVYMAIVFVLSANPMPEQLPDYRHIDKLYHFGAYLVMGILWARAMHNGRAGSPALSELAAAALITISFGALVESYQSFLPYRSGDIIDAVANGAGALAGVVVYARVKRVPAQSADRRF